MKPAFRASSDFPGSIEPCRKVVDRCVQRWVWLAGILLAGSQSVAWCDDGKRLRIATYNASLYGTQAAEVHKRIGDGNDDQAEKVAAVVQVIRPDLLLINEIDYDAEGTVAKLLAKKFFAVAQGNRDPIDYPFIYSVRSNTGLDSGLDLNNNGQTGEPSDAWGFGRYEGQYSMALFSRFPIDPSSVRTFQKYRWKDLPDPLRPSDPHSSDPYHEDQTWLQLRLSSKNHVDIPVRIGKQTIHVLASHPTPPVFDGPEDRNGCRNHDEIRFWVDYLAGSASGHLVDDKGTVGGLTADSHFVIMGDLNADPLDGDGRREAISQLLTHFLLRDPRPKRAGASEQDLESNLQGDPSLHTASFGDNRSLRLDYVLPSRSLKLLGSGVFWPAEGEMGHELISASDHRLVWIDVAVVNGDGNP